MSALRARLRAATANRWPWIFAVGLGVVIGRSWLAMQAVDRRTILLLAGIVLLAIIALVPWVIARRRRKLDLVELVYPFSVLYFVEFGARALWIWLDSERFALQTPHPSVVHASLVPAVFVAALGLGAYLGAYFAPRVWEPRPRLLSAGEEFPVWIVPVIYGIGTLLRLPFLIQGWFMGFAARSFAGEVPPLLHSVGYLGLLGTIGYTFAIAVYLRSERPAWAGWLLWVVVLPTEALYTVLLGSKFALLNILIIPLVLRHYLVRPIRPAVFAAVAMLVLFVLTPLVTVYRQVASPDDLRGVGFAGGLVRLVVDFTAHVRALSWRDYLDMSVGVAIDRFMGTDALAAVMAAIPILMPFQYGSTLAWTGRILIPTVLWPEKYHAVTETLAPIPHVFGFADFSRGGLSITMPGELYWNFGVIGVALGMAAVGLLHRWIVSALRQPESPIRTALYALVWVGIVLSFEGWFYAAYANTLRILLLSAAIAWLAMRRPFRSQATAPAG